MRWLAHADVHIHSPILTSIHSHSKLLTRTHVNLHSQPLPFTLISSHTHLLSSPITSVRSHSLTVKFAVHVCMCCPLRFSFFFGLLTAEGMRDLLLWLTTLMAPQHGPACKYAARSWSGFAELFGQFSHFHSIARLA